MTKDTDSPEIAKVEPAPAPSKRLTPREYARAKTMYQSGEHTLKEVAEEVGVSPVALSKRFKKDNVERGANAKKVSAAVQRAIERTSAAQAEELAAYAHDLKTNALKAIDLFNKKAYADVAKSIQDKVPLGDKLNDLKALNEASKIVSLNYATGAKILGLDQTLGEEDQLPELQIHIMSEDDVVELRERQRQEIAEANGELIDDEALGGELTDEDIAVIDELVGEDGGA